MEAADTMDIKADSEKTVKDILVSEGDEVQVGTPLFTYDTKAVSYTHLGLLSQWQVLVYQSQLL